MSAVAVVLTVVLPAVVMAVVRIPHVGLDVVVVLLIFTASPICLLKP